MAYLTKKEIDFLKKRLRARLDEHRKELDLTKDLEDDVIFPKYGESARIFYMTKQPKAGTRFPYLKRPEGSLPDMMLKDEKVYHYLIHEGGYKETSDGEWKIKPEAQLIRWDKGEVDSKNLDTIVFKAYLAYIGIENTEAFKKAYQESIPKNQTIPDPIPPRMQSWKLLLLPILTGAFFLLVAIKFCQPDEAKYDINLNLKLPGIVGDRLVAKYDKICGDIDIAYDSNGYSITGRRTGLFETGKNVLDSIQDLKITHVSNTLNSLFFKFEIPTLGQNKSKGFVDLIGIDPNPKPKSISGQIHYLYEDKDRHWCEVDIFFARNDTKPTQLKSMEDPLNICGHWDYTVTASITDPIIKMINGRK